MMHLRVLVGFALLALGLSVALTPAQHAYAEQTVPQLFAYNAKLKDSSGNAITTNHSVRFSLWNTSDFVSGDVTATGAIHEAASTYAGWNEVQSVTPNSDGYFTVELGSVTSLPNFASFSNSDLANLHFQIEVKAASAADTAYELLDVDSSSTTKDRAPLLSVPFASNADMLDKRHAGTGSGSIPVLGPGGYIEQAGTNKDRFTIDADNSTGGTISLRFGLTLAKEIGYEQAASRFNFNDDVRIQGNLTVTGLINGIDLASLANDNDVHLKVSSGAGLQVNVAAGGLRLNGNVTDYAGQTGVSVTDEATNYVFFGSGGLTVSTIGFPTDESAIRLAEVVTTGGAITSLTDRRVLSSDDREETIELSLHPGYKDSVFKGDATNNVGQLKLDHDATSQSNYYQWTSSKSNLQDYDIIVRVPLSSDFVRWQDAGATNPLTITYRSSSASSDDNKLDISVFDTAGTAVTLSGSTTSLAATDWTTTQIEFNDGGTWTAGQDFLVKFKVSAKDNKQMHLGSVKLQYVDLHQE